MLTQNRYKGLRKLANSKLEFIKRENKKVENLISGIHNNLKEGYVFTKYKKGCSYFSNRLENRMNEDGLKYEIIMDGNTGEYFIEVM